MPHDLEEENSSEDNSKVLFCHANKNDLAILKEEIRQSVSVVDDLIDRHPQYPEEEQEILRTRLKNILFEHGNTLINHYRNWSLFDDYGHEKNANGEYTTKEDQNIVKFNDIYESMLRKVIQTCQATPTPRIPFKLDFELPTVLYLDKEKQQPLTYETIIALKSFEPLIQKCKELQAMRDQQKNINRRIKEAWQRHQRRVEVRQRRYNRIFSKQ